MKLINTGTLRLEEYLDASAPPYAILSHTWEDEEVLYQEFIQPAGPHLQKKGYTKIVQTCRLAREASFTHCWVDTCCIDKLSSAELTESINSMFKWYQQSAVCLVYLSDLLPTDDPAKKLASCRWFTRGWTLQELLAPRQLWFFDQSWTFRGSKDDFTAELLSITQIQRRYLFDQQPLRNAPVARKMAWAASRKTTRVEDAAYSLLGIFGINMPLIYGEGQAAFRRLQEEIMKQTNDLTIFHWTHGSKGGEAPDASWYIDLFAASPANFNQSARMSPHNRTFLDPEFSMTNKGLRITSCLLVSDLRPPQLVVGREWKTLDSVNDQFHNVCIFLRKIGPDLYVREGRATSTRAIMYDLTRDDTHWMMRTFYIATEAAEVEMFKWYPTPANKFFFFPTNSNFRVSDVTPTSHWDASNRMFFPPGSAEQIFAVKLRIYSYGRWVPDLLLVLDQRGKTPEIYVLSDGT
ncbi:hypothetical protein OQA88_10454 [Cercophora sp. LCS_1]